MSSSIRRLRALLAALAISVTATSVGGCVDKPTEHRVRANAYLRNGDADKALEEIDLGLKKDENNLSLLILKGKALFELERYDDAKATYEKAVELGKSTPEQLSEAHLGLAIVAMRAEAWPEARKHFKTLVDQNERDADARLNLARVCLQMKDMECAVTYGEQAGHLRGASEDVLFTLGRIYTAAKKYDEAEKTFSRICEVVPNASSCPYGVALVAAQKGDTERAIAKLKEAVDRKMPNPDKIADDPMLAPLKDNPEFGKLIESAKGS